MLVPPKPFSLRFKSPIPARPSWSEFLWAGCLVYGFPTCPNAESKARGKTFHPVESGKTVVPRKQSIASFWRVKGAEWNGTDTFPVHFPKPTISQNEMALHPCRSCGGEELGLSDSYTRTLSPYRSVNPEQGFYMARYKLRQTLGSFSPYEVLIRKLNRRSSSPYRTDAFDSCLR
jgi:hypothetical protein